MKLNIVCALILFVLTFGVRLEVSAPELFGHAVGYGVQGIGREFILIPVHWPGQSFLFLMRGAAAYDGTVSGKIIQLLGERIETYPPYECSTATSYCYERSNKKTRRGWIEFRGHKRPFCGDQEIGRPCLKGDA